MTPRNHRWPDPAPFRPTARGAHIPTKPGRYAVMSDGRYVSEDQALAQEAAGTLTGTIMQWKSVLQFREGETQWAGKEDEPGAKPDDERWEPGKAASLNRELDGLMAQGITRRDDPRILDWLKRSATAQEAWHDRESPSVIAGLRAEDV